MIVFRKLFAKPWRNVDNLFSLPLPTFENINWWWRLGGGEVWCEVCLHLWSMQGKTGKMKNSVITPVLIGRGDRVQQQIIWEWENPRCDWNRLQPHQVGKGINTCTLMREPHIFDFVYSEKKKTKYVKSELRLIETLDGICDRILAYNIHKVLGKRMSSTWLEPFPFISGEERLDKICKRSKWDLQHPGRSCGQRCQGEFKICCDWLEIKSVTDL